jgi:hypothetical protein
MEDDLPLGYLGPVQIKIQQELGQISWGWELCGNCASMANCPDSKCPWARTDVLQSFWKLYRSMTDACYPERLGRQPALSCHEDLLWLMRKIQHSRDVAREALLRECFETHQPTSGRPPTSIDQNRAFNIAASLLFMMDFGIMHGGGNNCDRNTPLIPWRDRLSAKLFLAEAFPEARDSAEVRNAAVDLTASQLKKHGKLQLKATNDIRSHLVLDHEERTVWIFHHTTMLRESLKCGEGDEEACMLPRKLILEVLDTLHLVLFPPNPASYKLLDQLVRRHGFDSGLLAYASASYRNSVDSESSYSYFGGRLLALHNEMQSPRPHGWLQERLGRKRDTYMLMATMIGVFIAVLIGLLSLAVSCFQAWVGYQQWKHPQ